ncbi:MAG: TIGR03435 family protein [Terriglobia bacterium]
MIGELSNHLWQSTVFAILAGLLTLAFRRNRAQVRYWLWFSASLKFLIPFSILLTLGGYLGRSRPASSVAVPPITYTVVQIAEPFPDAHAPAPMPQPHADWIPITLIGLWACGLAGIGLMRLRGWLRIRSAMRASTSLDISFPVEVRSSPGLLEPGVVGFFHPILLCPKGIVERLTPSQLQAVLGHERCHIERRDNLTAAIHMTVEAVFWFHPRVWWISARLMEERERACDEGVLESGSEPQVYAESILKTCRFCVESPLTCVSGITGAELKERIVWIMTEGLAYRLSFGKKLLLIAIGVAAAAGPVVFGLVNPPQIRAQSVQIPDAPLPPFEVVSIKPNRPDDRRVELMFRPGRFVAAGLPIKSVITLAYQVGDFQLSGPGWINSEKYEIEAKEEDSVAKELESLPYEQRWVKQQLMLQALLADRFKLKVSHKTKEGTIYVLAIAKNGPKFQEAKPGDTYPNGIKRHDGRPFGQANVVQSGWGHFTGQGIAIAKLVQVLSAELNSVVADQTGLKGNYDFSLRWTDQAHPAMPKGQEGSKQGTDGGLLPMSSEPSLFTALQEQLGLKLQSTKAPVDFLVIDHIERPSEN